MTLVDTSVWVDHLRKGNRALAELLVEGRVLTHPFVIGELACGNLGNRAEILRLLSQLPKAKVAQDDEVLAVIEDRKLSGHGIGRVDVHLLASALLSLASLWSLNKKHAAVTAKLQLDR